MVRIDAPRNQLVVGRREELATTEVRLRDLSFVAAPPSRPLRCAARLRYHSRAVAATLGANDRLVLDEPFFGAAPGQSAVLYDGTKVLGGGLIADR